MAAIVLIRGGVLYPALSREMDWAVWVILAFMVMNTLVNWRSESDRERRIMTPLTLVIALLLLVVQLAPVA